MTFGFLLFFGVFLSIQIVDKDLQPVTIYSQNLELLPTTTDSPYQIINDIFTTKANNYEDDGYFPQIYGSSIQATYYALFILNSIGKIDVVNDSKISNYIMSYYNSSSGIFMDEYALRYLGTDFDYVYYPHSTLLEVNCYALLSLSLIGSINLIDIGKLIDFLWSCYNPITSGFIGQPYNSDLEEGFKISTMDNTYFAIKTLNMLNLGSWTGYTTQKDELIIYVNALQNTNPSVWQYGGFYNDNDNLFDSLGMLFEPNLLSSYYCLKSLEVFEMVSSIDENSFNQFLDSLYDPVDHYFQMSQAVSTNFTNLVATAIGLELSEIINNTNINKGMVLSFLYNNRNAVGLWDSSTSFQNYELMDTFQILRGLKNNQAVSMLSSDDTQQIITSLFSLFSNSEQFFLIPKEFNTMDLTYTMISSYALFDKISELNLPQLYSTISDSYFYDDYLLFDGFTSYINDNSDKSYIGFRSFPLEFYSIGDKSYINNIGYYLSHRATYQALASLKSMYKLDDFGTTHDLDRLLNNVVDTQFLNALYPEQNGAFLPCREYEPIRADMLSKDIFLEYSFYAIKTMELLTEYLNIGDITFIDFDITQLFNYLISHKVETSDFLYFLPRYIDEIDTVLQNTYYVIYILKTLDLYTLDSEKIEQFIELHFDYSNIKNIYYCYKIIDLLDLDFELNDNTLQGLINDLFDPASHEFYRTTAHKTINQDILLWISDIAKTDPLAIISQYKGDITLGSYLSISASLSNLVLSGLDYNLTFKFESYQLGDHVFNEDGGNQFSLEIYIPQLSTNYPTITGNVIAYHNTLKLAEKTISITTSYNQKYYKDEVNAAVILSTLFLGVPGGFILISGKKSKRFHN
ncbi:MAG: prenyltransferase/squalene oxidase repeat-containing protein [Promethearchaeota archaeon]|jgi:hypothetical protein